ncbi:unnamed protein product, partial [Adineta steineri]
MIGNIVDSVPIGSISNVTFIASTMGETFFNTSCQQCICVGLTANAVGWNCMTNNNTCSLINNYSTTDIGLRQTENTIFFFQQIPPELLTTSTTFTTTSSTSTTASTVTTST